MTQMGDQLQQQLNTQMKAVTNLAEQTAAILLARHQTSITNMEANDFLYVSAYLYIFNTAVLPLPQQFPAINSVGRLKSFD